MNITQELKLRKKVKSKEETFVNQVFIDEIFTTVFKIQNLKTLQYHYMFLKNY